MLLFETSKRIEKCGLEPRPYQIEDFEKSFHYWDSGNVGTLSRLFTGAGKTLCACMKFERWLERENTKCLVISYEKQLVWQFSQEIEDILGVTPGIEMEKEYCRVGQIPDIVVASRQTLMRHKLATVEQRDELLKYGVDVGERLLSMPNAKRAIRRLMDGEIESGTVDDEIDQFQEHWMCDHSSGTISRLHKFDTSVNWLVCFDEAHKYARKLVTVGNIVEWFERNKSHRRFGLTATPRRSDGTSIKSLFPKVSVDMSLATGIKEGWSVPMDQKFVRIENIDFADIKKLAGNSQSKWDAEIAAQLETQLAEFCVPLLDLTGNLRTLAFFPSVKLVQEAAAFVNARKPGSAVGVWGELNPRDRQKIYQEHKSGLVQYLFACGLCVAKDTLILTDCGEVPIQNVTTSMRVWDGVEYVSHGGVIHKGHRATIEYAGLRATEDHNVWTKDEWKTLADCKKRGLAISVSGIGGRPVRESDRYYRADSLCWQSASTGSQLCGVREENASPILSVSEGKVELSTMLYAQQPSQQNAEQCSGWQDVLRTSPSDQRRYRTSWREQSGWIGSSVCGLWCRIHEGFVGIANWTRWLQALLQAIRRPQLVANALPFCKEAMQQFNGQEIFRLWRTWHQVQLLIADGNGTLDHGTSGGVPAIESGSKGQQRTLRTGQLAVCDTHGAGQQSATATEEVYDILNAGPRHRFTANGLIVSNCRESYNDQAIMCVAIFRPVRKSAISLAEQMKGRGCRVLPHVLDGLETAEERLAAIAASAKPSVLIIDLVGAGGLNDCATTIQIYAEGQPDEVIARAEEIALLGGLPPDECIEKAKRDIAEEKEEKERRLQAVIEEREAAARRRAEANVQVEYSVHNVGTSANGISRSGNLATDKQRKYLWVLGFKDINNYPNLTLKQASRIIGQLKSGQTMADVQRTNRLSTAHKANTRPVVDEPHGADMPDYDEMFSLFR